MVVRGQKRLRGRLLKPLVLERSQSLEYQAPGNALDSTPYCMTKPAAGHLRRLTWGKQ